MKDRERPTGTRQGFINRVEKGKEILVLTSFRASALRLSESYRLSPAPLQSKLSGVRVVFISQKRTKKSEPTEKLQLIIDE